MCRAERGRDVAGGSFHPRDSYGVQTSVLAKNTSSRAFANTAAVVGGQHCLLVLRLAAPPPWLALPCPPPPNRLAGCRALSFCGRLYLMTKPT